MYFSARHCLYSSSSEGGILNSSKPGPRVPTNRSKTDPGEAMGCPPLVSLSPTADIVRRRSAAKAEPANKTRPVLVRLLSTHWFSKRILYHLVYSDLLNLASANSVLCDLVGDSFQVWSMTEANFENWELSEADFSKLVEEARGSCDGRLRR